MNDIKEELINLVGKVIVFGPEIESWETYAEPGMKAVVTKFKYDSDLNDPCHKIMIDYASFEADNHKRQNANYFDGSGNACLTAVEAGYYEPQDWLYLDNDPATWPFTVVGKE